MGEFAKIRVGFGESEYRVEDRGHNKLGEPPDRMRPAGVTRFSVWPMRIGLVRFGMGLRGKVRGFDRPGFATSGQGSVWRTGRI